MAKSPSTRRLPPPAWMLIAFLAQRLFARKSRSTSRSRAAATALTVTSSALAMSAVAAMSEAKTQLNPVHPERSTRLLTGGPFRFTRNPIYVAMAGVLVAHALLRRSWAALLPAAGFVAVIDRTQIPLEEKALRGRFKRKYDRYRRTTPRWLGRRQQS